jgi:acyl carrier protein
MEATATARRAEEVVVEALVELGVDRSAIQRDATFESLDVDSLDLVEVTQVVEERLGVEIRGDEAKDLATVGAAVDLIAARIP